MMRQVKNTKEIKSVYPGKLKLIKYLLTHLIIFLTFFPVASFSQGDLLITPRRLVFEGSRRSFDLNLANIGKDTATYAISLVQIKMLEDGGFETITEPDPGQRFADRFIRFFPRTVTLGPNEAQTVKVQLIRTNELESGEYRSHFYFRAIPNAAPLGLKETQSDSSTISVRLTPVFGITIPVIIRVGSSTAGVTISDFDFNLGDDGIPRVSLLLTRTGNMSVYGDLVVDYISPQGKTLRAGMANGVAVYTPNTTRKFSFNLMNVPNVDYSTGKLRITYSTSSDVKPEIYDEAELVINK
jgi:hypothetical protein